VLFEDLHHTTGHPQEGIEWSTRRKNLRYCAILGDPGFGKTWLLRKEAQRAAAEILDRLAGNRSFLDLPIPFLLTVNALAPGSDTDSSDPWRRLVEGCLRAVSVPDPVRERVANTLLAQIHSGRPVLVLLDGG
jgi:hypothetical protein